MGRIRSSRTNDRLGKKYRIKQNNTKPFCTNKPIFCINSSRKKIKNGSSAFWWTRIESFERVIQCAPYTHNICFIHVFFNAIIKFIFVSLLTNNEGSTLSRFNNRRISRIRHVCFSEGAVYLSSWNWQIGTIMRQGHLKWHNLFYRCAVALSAL